MKALPRRDLAGLVLLVLAVLAVYAPTRAFEFVTFDDPEYVTGNPMVNRGLQADAVAAAFTRAHSNNWHPLTWLSHMLDVELFGLDPGPHHLVNVALHVLNVVLCFLLLRRLRAGSAAAFLIAGLFALHPLRVESVAWVSERKDVLSGVFFFGTLHAWLGWRERGGAGRLFGALGLYALGLAAKPMLVTLPLVTWWLERTWLARTDRGDFGLRRLAREWPFFAMALASAVVTLLVQRAGGAVRTLAAIPLEARLANACASLATYARQCLVPLDLAYFYPHPALSSPDASPWTAGVFAGLALLVVGAGVAFALRRGWPALALGAGLFLVLLLPVLGLIQVGEQAHADRYAYLPLLGLHVAVVGLGAGCVRRWPALARPLLLLGCLALVGYGALAARQVRTWRDSEALYTHALAVTERNFAAHTQLGNLAHAEGRAREAARQWQAALALRPDYSPALYGMGLFHQERGELVLARTFYERAVAAQPDARDAWLNLGSVRGQLNHRSGAAEAFARALELDPRHAAARYGLGALWLSANKPDAAIGELQAALEADPDFQLARERLGVAYDQVGRHREAVAQFSELLGQAGTPAHVPGLLAWILATCPDADVRDPARALEVLGPEPTGGAAEDPGRADARAAALADLGEFERALAVLEAAQGSAPPSLRAAMGRRASQYRAGEAFRHQH